MSKLLTYVPLFQQIKSYRKSQLSDDLFAGLTVGTVLIPQAMAYALLAGVEPIYGLYAGLVPLLVYALFGSSIKLSVGPVAVSAILVFDGVRKIAEPMSGEFLTLVISLGFFIGIFQMLLGLLRLGSLVNFLSHPVIAGFTSAAAIIIIGTQLKDILGFSFPSLDTTFDTYSYALQNLGSTHGLSLMIGLGALVFILAIKRFLPRVPGPFLAVVISIIGCYFWRLDTMGLSIVGSVPDGLPEFASPALNLSNFQKLLPTIFTVTLIGIVESLGIARAMEGKYKDHKVRPNQELFALGISKVLGSFFYAIPSSGSFSRSAINANSNARTNVSSLVTFILIAVALLFLTSLFYYLPKAVLAAIILLSVAGLFDYKEAVNLWRTHRQDFAMMMITFLVTLLMGIETGVFSGVILSVLMVIYRSAKPHVTVIGNIPGTTYYRNVDRYEKAEGLANGVIIRFDDQLYFGNADYFKNKVLQIVDEQPNVVKYILLEAQNMHDIDSSGIHKLRDLDNHLKSEDIELHMCSAMGPVRDMLHISGLLSEAGRHHASVHDAVQFIKGRVDLEDRPADPFQHNK